MRQNTVMLSQKASFQIDCEVYNINDGDRQAIMQASTHDVKRVAKICGCMTCLGYLINIDGGIMSYKSAGINKRFVRGNRRYFIQKLREALASPNIKHNFQNFIQES
jgi:hypothetical protein